MGFFVSICKIRSLGIPRRGSVRPGARDARLLCLEGIRGCLRLRDSLKQRSLGRPGTLCLSRSRLREQLLPPLLLERTPRALDGLLLSTRRPVPRLFDGSLERVADLFDGGLSGGLGARSGGGAAHDVAARRRRGRRARRRRLRYTCGHGAEDVFRGGHHRLGGEGSVERAQRALAVSILASLEERAADAHGAEREHGRRGLCGRGARLSWAKGFSGHFVRQRIDHWLRHHLGHVHLGRHLCYEL